MILSKMFIHMIVYKKVFVIWSLNIEGREFLMFLITMFLRSAFFFLDSLNATEHNIEIL